jgi:hypothetical protein
VSGPHSLRPETIGWSSHATTPFHDPVARELPPSVDRDTYVAGHPHVPAYQQHTIQGCHVRAAEGSPRFGFDQDLECQTPHGRWFFPQPGRLALGSLEGLLGLATQQRRGLARVVGEVRELLGQLRIFGAQRRQERVAHAHPQVGRIEVAGIVRLREAGPRGVLVHLGATTVDQRTHHAVGSSGCDGAQSLDARPAQQAREHRLGLIVERVSDGDTLRSVRCGTSCEGRIAGVARSGLPRGTSLQLDAQRHERDHERGREPTGDRDLFGGLGAKAMVDRSRGQSAAVIVTERVEHVQQDLRVRSTRAGDQDVGGALKQGALVQRSADAVEKSGPWAQKRPEISETRVDVFCGRL